MNDIVMLVKQQLIKEQIQETKLSHLESDFYRNINNYRKKSSKEEIELVDPLIHQLLRMRIGKLILMIDQDDIKNYKELLADEECLFWERITNAQEDLKKTALHEVMKQ